MNNEFQSLSMEVKEELMMLADMQPCKSVEEVKEQMAHTEKGGIQNTMENVVKALRCDPLLYGAVGLNILTGRVDVMKPMWWGKDSPTMNDTDFNYLMLYLESRYGLNNENKIRKALNVVAHQNQYHPIRNYLNRLEWDGAERIRYVLNHFLGAEICEYTYQVMLLFLLGAISRVFQPGCKFEQMLCLVGGQGAGKSTFFRFLAIKDEWFTDDLKNLEDENVFRKMQGHWIIEMSEMMATSNAKSIEVIKSFISRMKETYKTPYATEPEDRLRQCVFGGTSNALDFLPLDRTGNRRFLPVTVNMDDAKVHILDNEKQSREYMDQLWAEAMVIYKSGKYKLKLSKDMEKYLKELQKQFMPEDTKVGMIQSYLDNFKGNQVCSKQIYKEALHHLYDAPKQWEIREINDMMNHSVTGWVQFKNPRYFGEYGRQRGWERDNTKSTTNKDSSDGFQKVDEQMKLPFDEI